MPKRSSKKRAKRAPAQIDPVLKTELDQKAASETVGAIVRLRPTRPGLHAPPPGEVESLAKTVLGRVSAASGSRPGSVNVMPNLGSIAVRANVDFVRRLVQEEEVAAAISSSHRATAL